MLSRITPRLLTWGEGETDELSIVREKLLVLDRADLVPMRRTSVLLLFNLRKFRVNQVFILIINTIIITGGSVLGLVELKRSSSSSSANRLGAAGFAELSLEL